MQTQFSQFDVKPWQPLADRLRPKRLAEFVGQGHLLAPGKPLRESFAARALHSMIFWGPPGTGKTTLARLIAANSGAHFIGISAVFAGVKDIRAAVQEAKQAHSDGKPTVLFVDEVHRFNKAQQDGFLPFIEDGTLTFMGATTENPSFELNNALLSRARIYVLKPLQVEDIKQLLQHALSDKEYGLGALELTMSDSALDLLARAADGDARRALNMLEIASDLISQQEGARMMDDNFIKEVVGTGARRFDKGGDIFYDQISALHKSVRGSDPDAALYWFARMLDGGCDALYIARRVVRMACEDIGNADPHALQVALNGWEAQERLGSPEGELALAQAIVYLACAPKSNAVYAAFNAATDDARAQGSLEVPLHLRNAPTKLMQQLGHGKDYRYAHDEPNAYAAGENYFPEGMKTQFYYRPQPRGFEQEIARHLQGLRERGQAKGGVAVDGKQKTLSD